MGIGCGYRLWVSARPAELVGGCSRLRRRALTEAFHLGAEEVPWVDTGTGVELTLVQADIEAGLWIVRNRFAAGVVVPKHRPPVRCTATR